MNGVYIGALSGTSMDALDVVAVRFPGAGVELIARANETLPESFRKRMIALQRRDVRTPRQAEPEHGELGRLFATAITRLIRNKLGDAPVHAIGLHGQTILHRPRANPPFTLQIGDPQIVAAETGCTVAADFRQSDLAAGGQGAPLAPTFHRAFFSKSGEVRVIVNVGGISNLTWLDGDGVSGGCDCGPGNVLLDSWIRRNRGEAYDCNGTWARSGACDDSLLARMMEDEFFRHAPPKSACTTDFNLEWLERHISDTAGSPTPEDVQATLAELTVRGIADAVNAYSPRPSWVFICGGGAHNDFLMERLQALLKAPVADTGTCGLPPDWVEAAGFAWLARRCLDDETTDLTAVTGASEPVVLGRIYQS